MKNNGKFVYSIDYQPDFGMRRTYGTIFKTRKEAIAEIDKVGLKEAFVGSLFLRD